MTCTHRLADGPLVCKRTDPHDTGHVYHSSAGGHVEDHDHEAGEG